MRKNLYSIILEVDTEVLADDYKQAEKIARQIKNSIDRHLNENENLDTIISIKELFSIEKEYIK